MDTINITKNIPDQQLVAANSVTIDLPNPPKRFYTHGWQSWSLASWVGARDILPAQKPQILQPMQQDPNYALHPFPHGSWVGAVELEQDNILLLGSLDLDAHVELVKDKLHGWYESGSGDWFIGYGTERSIFSRYAELLGQRLGGSTNRRTPRVWCSWYSLYTAINETILSKVISGLGDLPFDIIQVDDGWQANVGNWEPNNKFPSGMKSLADKIKNTGRIAGLWLAPLIAVKSSRTFRYHSEWFLRDEHDRLVSAGFNWGEQLYALDTTLPEVSLWLYSLMKQVCDWGFDYIKLDFLYGGALPGRRHTDIPREIAYRKTLRLLRGAMGEKTFLLACGAPIVPSLGICDALRIGPDVSPEWENKRDAVLLYNSAIPGTRNAIRTSLHRRWLNPLVITDPDVVYFRTKECSLSEGQKNLLQSLALIFDFKATSDLPEWLNPEEREKLRVFLNRSPKIDELSPYKFDVDGQIIDFNSVISLPDNPKGIDHILRGVIGWMGNQAWILKILNNRLQTSLNKKTRNLYKNVD